MIARARLRSLVLALSACAWVSSAALAQPSDDDIAKAKKRFEEGKAFEDSEKWSDALAAFNDVAAVKMTPQVRFQIAFCDENLGHLVAAIRGYDEAVSLAQKDEERAKDVLKAAPVRAQALKAKVPHVNLDITGAGAQKTHFAVLIDDAPIDQGSLHAPIELDVGTHAIDLETVSSEGKEKKHVADVALAEHQEKTVRIEVPLVDATDVGSEPIKEAPKPEPEKPGNKIPAIVVGSVGIASLITSAVFLGLRQDTIATVSASCRSADMLSKCSPALKDTADNGRNYTYASVSLALIGVAALGTATALWFTVGKSTPGKPASTSIVLSPTQARLLTRF